MKHSHTWLQLTNPQPGQRFRQSTHRLMEHYCFGQISQRPCNNRCVLDVNYTLGIDSPAGLKRQWPLLKAKNDLKM